MSMNPFELRYELVKTAREIVEQQFNAQMESWRLAEKAIADLPAPSIPTLDDILKTAERLNMFVSYK